MKLAVDHLGASYGQHDYEMRVTDGVAVAGVLSFSEFGGVPHVNWIRVEDDYAGRGIAGRMVRNLQSRYPGMPIDFGYTTPEGTALMERLDFREEPNPAYDAATTTAARCRAELARFETAYERLSLVSDQERHRLMEALERWNEVSDELDEAERILQCEPRLLRFVITEGRTDDASEFVMPSSKL